MADRPAWWPIVGAVVFFVVAPGIVAGWVPFWLTKWHMEPTLRAQFGPSYDEYRKNVRRWWPRLRPWSG